MFTGIIEQLGELVQIVEEGTNLNFKVKASFYDELQIDQSVAHNGVCLTVTEIQGDCYWVTAIKETLDKTNLGDWKVGELINLERCMKLGERLDGHIVQGHVDTTGTCTKIENIDGSWNFYFQYDFDQVTVEKGSITINGTSLTVVESDTKAFSVSIIPYTYEHTNFKTFEVGTRVNLEFDVIGKYVARLLKQQ